jgi:hypothetical protein
MSARNFDLWRANNPKGLSSTKSAQSFVIKVQNDSAGTADPSGQSIVIFSLGRFNTDIEILSLSVGGTIANIGALNTPLNGVFSLRITPGNSSGFKPFPSVSFNPGTSYGAFVGGIDLFLVSQDSFTEIYFNEGEIIVNPSSSLTASMFVNLNVPATSIITTIMYLRYREIPN